MIVLGGMNIVNADADHPMVGFTGYADGRWQTPIGEARFDEPAAYDPASDTWRVLAPWPTRLDFIDSVTWTGSELVVVGPPAQPTDGFRGPTMLVYSPSSDAWREVDVPAAGQPDVSVWTGEEILFWGYAYHQPESIPVALAWRPSDGRWRAFDRGPLSFRELPGAVWTGREMVIVGGDGPDSDTAAYDPAADAWRTLPPTPAGIAARSRRDLDGHRGPRLGRRRAVQRSHGRRVQPRDRQLACRQPAAARSPLLPPRAVDRHRDARHRRHRRTTASVGAPSAGAAYNPVTDTWRELPPTPGVATCQSAGVWTGTHVIVWAGNEGCDYTPNIPREAGYATQLG